MVPVIDDWNLIRWMFLNQKDLFKRFFWTLKSAHWFEITVSHWYPFLTHQPDNYEWCSTFIRKLDVWMNIYPKEIVEIWNNALNENWGKDNVWWICRDLTQFKHYHVDGVKDLVYALEACNNSDSHFMGTIYCNYIEATGDGYEILWVWMTRDISLKELNTWSKKNELYCDSHDLNNGDFLKKHLNKSEEFLNLVLKSLLGWVENSSYWKEDGLTCKLLEYTSIPNEISHSGSINIERTYRLIGD